MRRTLQTIISTAITLLLVAVVGLLVVLPRATGAQPLTVLTGSMSPTVPAGSLALVRPVPAAEVRVDDVLTFAVPSQGDRTVLVTHRVLAVEEAPLPGSGDMVLTFTTKGDANRTPDRDPVLAQNVRGVLWFHVPHLGRVLQVAQGPGGMAAVASAGLALLALSLVLGPVGPRRQPSADDSVDAEASSPSTPSPTR